MAVATALTPALDGLATLFVYPTQATRDAARAVQADVAEICSEAATLLEPTVVHLEEADLSPCEELFVRTFELNPVCALEVGWQVYGEQYARGAFLVRMRELVRETGATWESVELPDHLSNVLRVLGRVEDATARKLAGSFTLPALERMSGHFDEESGNPYRGLLAATAALLRHVFGGEEVSGE